MSCILTNLSDSQEDTLCSSPHVFAHWHIFPSIALCHSIEFQMHLSIWVPSDVYKITFFLSHTPTHRTGSRCGPNLCLLFIFCQLCLSFSCFLSPLFLSVLFKGSKKGTNMEKVNDKDTETEKKSQESAGRDCRLGTLSMMALLQSRERKCLSSTDSVRRGSVWI